MIRCDRCGRKMTDTWTTTDGSGVSYGGGNCAECGDNLCSNCAGEWAQNHAGDDICEKCCATKLKPMEEVLRRRNAGAFKAEGRKEDAGKLRWDLLPWREVEKVVEVLTYGANKYAPDNWKKVEPFRERYSAALMRHFVAWEKGEQLDEESGLHHLAQTAVNALFLLWWEAEQHGNTKGA